MPAVSGAPASEMAKKYAAGSKVSKVRCVGAKGTLGRFGVRTSLRRVGTIGVVKTAGRPLEVANLHDTSAPAPSAAALRVLDAPLPHADESLNSSPAALRI